MSHHGIQLALMPQLAEAVDKEDDWTGLTDAAARRKKQNRLNVRAYRRRRKDIQTQKHVPSVPSCQDSTVEAEAPVACWVEDQQMIFFFSPSVANALNNMQTPILPFAICHSHPYPLNHQSAARIMFPLTLDHLIPLLQFNVLRALITNRLLISSIKPLVQGDCSSVALHVLPIPNNLDSIPPSLKPTYLQSMIPHEDWVDIIPHPTWRDNVLLALGKFNEDELWSDTIGGLFEGFPASEVERRGIIAWDLPWDVSGWEVSEGFWLKWKWLFGGCKDVLEATNRWRSKRGENPLEF